MVTVYKLVCKSCDYEYPTPVGKMEGMPETCGECGGTSFNVMKEELEVEDEVEYLRNKTDFSDLEVWELEDYQKQRKEYRR